MKNWLSRTVRAVVVLHFSLFFFHSPALAQPQLQGRKVTYIKIKENNSYLDWKDKEFVFPPEGRLILDFWSHEQKFLPHGKERTRTMPIDSTLLPHLDSLLAELPQCRPTTAANLGITQKTMRKVLSNWFLRKDLGLFSPIWEIKYTREGLTVENLDRWLAQKYEEYRCDSISFHIITDMQISIGMEITVMPGAERKYISFWRYEPLFPYFLDGQQYFNPNVFRHLCALLPKGFGFSLEELQQTIIEQFYYEYGKEHAFDEIGKNIK
ncbi:MAG: hypothetical protein IJ634_04875 [Bacteroidales bacterium]|nr:hypothetical protein [Bacteroidales bacterium]